MQTAAGFLQRVDSGASPVYPIPVEDAVRTEGCTVPGDIFSLMLASCSALGRALMLRHGQIPGELWKDMTISDGDCVQLVGDTCRQNNRARGHGWSGTRAERL